MSGVELSVCTFNKKAPLYQPNIFVCPLNSNCCLDGFEAKCCASEATYKQNNAAMFLFFPLVLALSIVLLFIWSHVSDAHPVKPETCRKDMELITKIVTSGEKDYAEIVEDPVFGRLYHRKVSKKAYMEKHTALSQ